MCVAPFNKIEDTSVARAEERSGWGWGWGCMAPAAKLASKGRIRGTSRVHLLLEHLLSLKEVLLLLSLAFKAPSALNS